MNQNEGVAKHKNIYLEGLFIIFLLLGIPFLLLQLLIFFMKEYLSLSSAIPQAKAFCYIITCMYDLLIVFCGALSDSIKVVGKRINELFSTIRYIKLSKSVHYYLINIKDNGIFFWIYLGIIIYHFYCLYASIISCLG